MFDTMFVTDIMNFPAILDELGHQQKVEGDVSDRPSPCKDYFFHIIL